MIIMVGSRYYICDVRRCCFDIFPLEEFCAAIKHTNIIYPLTKGKIYYMVTELINRFNTPHIIPLMNVGHYFELPIIISKHKQE